jgi:prenylcysteine oxidase/farnesylcysteine lyase
METTTISSRNVVDLLLTEQFGSGICGEKVELDQYEEWGEEKVWGWDCWGDRRDSYGAA